MRIFISLISKLILFVSLNFIYLVIAVFVYLELYRLLDPHSKPGVKALSYSRAREIVKDAFKDTTDVCCISLHNLRAGGASRPLMRALRRG